MQWPCCVQRSKQWPKHRSIIRPKSSAWPILKFSTHPPTALSTRHPCYPSHAYINHGCLGNSKGDSWVFSHSHSPLPSKTLTLDKGQGFEQGSRFSDPYPYPSVKPFTTLEGFHVKAGHIALAMSEQVLFFSVYKAS